MRNRLGLGLALAILLVPALVFSATVNVNLKDSMGADFADFANCTVKLLDGVGTIVNQQTPTSAQVSFSGLISGESYTVLTSYHKVLSTDQNGSVAVDTLSSKSVRFNDDTETMPKDFFIADPATSNVLLRVTRVPATLGSPVKVKLSPVESSRFNIDKAELAFDVAVDTQGNGELAVDGIPAGRYNWAFASGDQSQVLAGTGTKTARTDARMTMNTETMTNPTIGFTFTLQNADRSAAAFSGGTIAVEIKDPANATVYSKTITPSGATVTDTSTMLTPNTTYSVRAVYSDGVSNVTREALRTVALTASRKTSTISFVRLDTVNIDFLVRDGRNSAPLSAGTMLIKDSAGATLETVPITGPTVSKALVVGYPYKLEFSAPGYNTRVQNLYPRQNQVREISLTKI